MAEKHDVIINFPNFAKFKASWSLEFGRIFYKNFKFILNNFLFYRNTE